MVSQAWKGWRGRVSAYAAARAMAAVFYCQMQLLGLRAAHNHVVVCGLGRKGLLLVKGFVERGERVVAIELDGANPLVEAAWDAGATVLVGDATNPDLLCRARVQRARQLLVVCGDDGVNAEVAVRAGQLAAGRREGALECFAHLEMEVTSPEFERAAFLYDGEGHCDVTAAYVCLDDDPLALSTGLVLLQRLAQTRVPIVVRLEDETGLATLLGGVEGACGYDSLRPFPLLARTCRPEVLVGPA